MPKLPTAQSLGQTPVPQANFRVFGYGAGEAERSMEQAAAQAANIGQRTADFFERMSNRQDKISYARAKNKFFEEKIKLDGMFDEDQDFATFEDRYKQGIAKIGNDVLGLVSNPEDRELLKEDLQLDALRGIQEIRKKARVKEVDWGRAELDNTLTSSHDNALRTDDKLARQQLLDNAHDAIDGALERGYITQQEAVKKKKEFVEKYAEAWVKTFPADRQLEMLRPTMQTPSSRQVEVEAISNLPPEISSMIDTAAEKYGQDPAVLKRIAELESGGRVDAKNPNSSATGLFQFTKATAEKYGIDPTDPEQSADGAARYLKDIRNHLEEKLGRAPSNAELYLAYQQGQYGAAALLKADKNKLAVEALADVYEGDVKKARQAVINNGGTEDMTAGEFVQLWKEKYGKGGTVSTITEYKAEPIRDAEGRISFAKTGTYVDFIPPDKRMRMIEAAENDLRRQQIAYKTKLDLYLNEEYQNIENTGRRAGLLKDKDIILAYPNEPEKAQKIIAQLNNAERYYGVRQAVGLTSPEDDARILSALSKGMTGPNAVQGTRMYEDYVRAIQAKRKQLAEDPLAYVVGQDPSLAQALTSQDPKEFQRAVTHAGEMQARLGVPPEDRRYLGKANAARLAKQLETLPAEQAADRIEMLSQQYGPLFPQIRRELREAKINPVYDTIARLTLPSDALVRKALADAVNAGKENLRKNIPTDEARDIDDYVREELADFHKTLRFDGGEGQRIFDGEKESVTTLAYWYRINGQMGVRQAVEKAAADLLNDRFDFVDSFRAPKGMGGQVEAYAQSKLDELTADDFPAAKGGAPGVSDGYRQGAYFDYAMQGVWANTPNGDGIERLYPDGSPVILKNGQRIRVMFDEDMSKANPLPRDPAMRNRERMMRDELKYYQTPVPLGEE